MASEKEIKNRIKSISDTQKITNAMYLISSTKLRKARQQLEDTQPFFEAMRPAISRLLRYVPDINNVYFDDYVDPEGKIHAPDKEKRRAFLVITADKGLAGAYNHNVIKKVEDGLAKGGEYKLYVVGELGRQYFMSKGIPVSHHFLYTAQDPKLSRARAITQNILPAYEAGEIDEVYIIYTFMASSVREDAVVEKILPLHKEEYVPLDVAQLQTEQMEYIIWPSPNDVINHLMPDYFAGYVYAALVEAFACEQNARMTAMKAANDSANEMLKDLNIQYNHIRQASITQEITEVIGGAKALKKKKK